MNIFVCDLHPVQAAQHLADRHVVKMVLETAQVLATVAQLKEITWKDQYKITHKHHPVVKGCMTDEDYLRWTACHGLALLSEYRYRYSREHKAQPHIEKALSTLCASGLWAAEPSPHWPKAVLDQYKDVEDVVQAYRLHLADKYIRWESKAKWTRRGPPEWLQEVSSLLLTRQLS